MKRTHYTKIPTRIRRRMKIPPLTLEYQLTEVLSQHCGQRGDNEGAVETLDRIIRERDAAMTKLALIAMHEKFFIR